jgi:anti-sigma regulatory factor (Ser/Thr protein kinase)/anti-anti-sigma regulatory factor
MSRETAVRSTLVVPADVDAGSCLAFLGGLDVLLCQPGIEVVLDCSRMQSASSSQVRILWHARGRCVAAGANMRLAYVGPALDRVLKLLDLRDLFLVETSAAPLASEARAVPHRDRSRVVFETTCQITIEGIAKAMAAFRSFLVDLDLPDVCVFDLATVFYEIATNIRQHAGLGSDENMSFSAMLENDKVRLRFEDSGRPFDPSCEVPMFDVREAIRRGRNRGIGLVMVGRLMDSVSYRRSEGRNILLLEKAVRQKGEASDAGKKED